MEDIQQKDDDESPLTVSIESLQEFQVQEINYKGEETYAKPLSMSENLAKLAHKIDFSVDNSDENEEDSGGVSQRKEKEEKEGKDGTATPFQVQQKPWEAVRNKIRTALTEISVLYDVVNIARMNRDPPYMVLDRVSSEPAASKDHAIRMIEKKKSLEGAAKILLAGAARMHMKFSNTSDKRSLADHQNFHNELLKLSQHWRLKKVGANILGDLSFRTAGSRFMHNGTFEVTKTSDEDHAEAERRNVQSCPLKVTVPSDLEGTSYIMVLIQEGDVDIATGFLNQSSRSMVSADAHWQERLEAAQNVLFCKELFATIAKEAVQLKAPIPHIVVGNQIICSIFPGINLCMRLCHDSNMGRQMADLMVNPNQNNALEHSLHHLLRELHHSNLNAPTPRPITASHTVVNKKRRLAGPLALDRKEIVEMQHAECLLEKILKQSRHIVLRNRTAKLLDRVSSEVKDPTITVHWSVLQQPLQSSVKVHFSSPGYELLLRNSLQLIIGTDSIRARLQDGRACTLSYEEKDLKDLIICQVSRHQVQAVSTLAKTLNMQILQYNLCVGTGKAPQMGNVSAVVFSTPNGKRSISVRSEPVKGATVCIQGDFEAKERGNVVSDPKWDTFPNSSKEVDISKIPGRNFVHKVELLMGNLGQLS